MSEISEESEQMQSSGQRPSSRSNAARQSAVNFMPSRQLPYGTVRRRKLTSEHHVLVDELDGDGADQDLADHQAEIIVKELEQQHKLMDDNPVSEELRREALRDLPQGLTMKRHVRAKLSASVSLRSKRRPVSLFKRIKYRISFAWKRSKERLRDAMFSIELWYEAIRNIEGQFGSAVGSYFRMVRRLVLLDAALAALLLLFIVLPQALHDSAAALDGHNATDQYWPVDWITGKGGMERSVMFYGHYHDDFTATAVPYNMPFAYFFTMVCLYLLFFAVLCYRTAYSYRRNFIETSGGLCHVFATKLFCGWDFGIVAAHAAALNRRTIYNELKELLNEQNRKRAPLSICTKLGQCLANVCVTALVLGSISAVLWMLWVLLERYSDWEVTVSATLIAIATLCPLVFHLVSRCEFYGPRSGLHVTLARTWLLHGGLLLLLFVFWARSGRPCWETRFGQETYRLVLLDAVVSLFLLPAVEICRALFFKWNRSGSGPEFNIAYNSLTLIYNQTVLWFGMLFSPLLAVAVTIKFLLLFYVKRECAMRACQPATKVWRAAQTQTVLYMLVTLSLFTAIFGIGSIFFRMPSAWCGPFQQYLLVWSVVSEGLLSLQARPALRAALGWLARPAVLAAAGLLLAVLVYIARARALAQQSMVGLLREMLVLQAKDKDFLLTAIAKVSNGEWLYSPKPEEGPDSHTFRYLREVRKPSNSNFHFDGSRLSRSFADRPKSFVKDRPLSSYVEKSNDGDTDSSFSWQGSGSNLNGSG